MTEPNPDSKTDPINLVTDEKKMDQGGGGSGGFGARPKKQNAQAQAKKHAKENKKTKTTQAIPPSNESVFREVFGPNTIRRDWSQIQGIVGDIINQQQKDICWAIVLARLMQAIFNLGLPINQQSDFSFLELVDQIKRNEKDLSLANLKIVFNHVAIIGMLKKPPTQHQEKANSQGPRIKKLFGLCEDVDASFIREKLDKYPVGLNLESTMELGLIGQKIYYLPKKKAFTPYSRFHTMILIGYGVTAEGELYFIGQNTWGNEWGCNGYVRIVINVKCDIICLKE